MRTSSSIVLFTQHNEGRICFSEISTPMNSRKLISICEFLLFCFVISSHHLDPLERSVFRNLGSGSWRVIKGSQFCWEKISCFNKLLWLSENNFHSNRFVVAFVSTTSPKMARTEFWRVTRMEFRDSNCIFSSPCHWDIPKPLLLGRLRVGTAFLVNPFERDCHKFLCFVKEEI